MRNLLGISDKVKLSARHVDAALGFLEEFKVSTLEHADDLIADVFYGIVPDVKSAVKINSRLAYKNETHYDEVTLASLGRDVENSFNQRNKFDTEIYEKLLPRCIKTEKSFFNKLLSGAANSDTSSRQAKKQNKILEPTLTCCNPTVVSIVYQSFLGEERVELNLGVDCAYYADGPVVQCDEDRPKYLHKSYWARVSFDHETGVWSGEASEPCFDLDLPGSRNGDACDPKGKYLDEDGALSFTII